MTEEVTELPDIPSVDEYTEVVRVTRGTVMQKNIIGALTVITAYRGLGHFETILWDDRHPDFRDKGELVSYWRTLETSQAFHYAYVTRLFKSAFGKSTRDRAKYLDDAAKEAVAEIKSDKVLFKDYED